MWLADARSEKMRLNSIGSKGVPKWSHRNDGERMSTPNDGKCTQLRTKGPDDYYSYAAVSATSEITTA
jgi:hypothetical protein